MVAICEFNMQKTRGNRNREALLKQKGLDAAKREARAAAKAHAIAKAERIARRSVGRQSAYTLEEMLEMPNPNRSAARIAFEKAQMEEVLKTCEEDVCEAVDAAKEESLVSEESVEFVEEEKEVEWELL